MCLLLTNWRQLLINVGVNKYLWKLHNWNWKSLQSHQSCCPNTGKTWLQKTTWLSMYRMYERHDYDDWRHLFCATTVTTRCVHARHEWRHPEEVSQFGDGVPLHVSAPCQRTYTGSQNNAPTLASCSFDKHWLILIIFGKQHQHTFKNDMHVQLSLSLHVYLLYLLLNSCNGNK